MKMYCMAIGFWNLYQINHKVLSYLKLHCSWSSSRKSLMFEKCKFTKFIFHALFLQFHLRLTPTPNHSTMSRREASPPEEVDEETVEVTFPSKLVARILQETFESPTTRVSADALAVVAEYLRVYAREAIWRAADEKTKTNTVAGNIGTSYLEVEDLERVVGALTLDFS